MAQRFGVTSSTTVRTATPTPGTAPVTGRYTRYVALHLLWGAAPVQNGCIAYRSGTPPTLTSTTAANGSTQPSQSPISHIIPWRPDFAAPHKPQNSNVLSSTVEASTGELRATMKRDATSREHRTSYWDLARRRRRLCTRYGALHPLRSATPLTGRCTRSERV